MRHIGMQRRSEEKRGSCTFWKACPALATIAQKGFWPTSEPSAPVSTLPRTSFRGSLGLVRRRQEESIALSTRRRERIRMKAEHSEAKVVSQLISFIDRVRAKARTLLLANPFRVGAVHEIPNALDPELGLVLKRLMAGVW
jgi:hypothetical protein